jgi:hypothetical protein
LSTHFFDSNAVTSFAITTSAKFLPSESSR